MHIRAMIARALPVKARMLMLRYRERAEVNTTDQIALLEGTRGQLSTQTMQLEKKIGEVKERQRETAESDSERERLMAGAGRGVER
jgi:hypothetical protein